MKAIFEHIKTGYEASIKAATYTQDFISVPLHYHPENEIVFFQKGSGSLFLNDKEEPFRQGDIFFIKGEVPHLFQDNNLFTGEKSISKVSVIQYPSSLFSNLKIIPEFERIINFEESIIYGVKLRADAQTRKIIRHLELVPDLIRFTRLSELLHAFSSTEQKVQIGGSVQMKVNQGVTGIRLKKINAFIEAGFRDEIGIKETAAFIHINPSSLCRLLKRETRKTFSALVNERRIKHACLLLRETNNTVLDICLSSGFNNPSYFYRQFKKVKGSTPDSYRKKYLRG